MTNPNNEHDEWARKALRECIARCFTTLSTLMSLQAEAVRKGWHV